MAQKSSELDNIEVNNSVTDSGGTNAAAQTPAEPSIDTDTENLSAPEISDDPDEIRVQIEETRVSLGETLDAIGEKLSFANVSEQVKEQVSEQLDSAVTSVKETIYDATVGKAENFVKNAGSVAETFMKNTGDVMKNTSQKISKSQIFKTAQDSPLPLLLIGLGIGLLTYRSFNSKKQAPRDAAKKYNQNYKKRSFQSSSKKSVLSGAPEKISDAYAGISNTASDAYKNAGEFANQAYQKAGDLGTRARRQYENYLEENPLVIGAVAAVIGAAVGLAIPATEYENELMGEARENLLQKAQDSTGDFVNKVKDFVNETGKNLGDEVRNQISAQQ